MSDQNQDLHQESEELIPNEKVLNHRFSRLHLDHRSMASVDAISDLAAGDDQIDDFADPSPPRSAYGNNTPLKRRCSSSAYSPPESRDLISEGYRVLHLPSGGNERPTTPLRRCLSLDSYCNSPIPVPPAEISNRGALAENQTRRSLFPTPVNGSGTGHALPPPHPLARAASDPVRYCSHLENPVLPAREKVPDPKTSPYTPCGVPGNRSCSDFAQEDSSSNKRLKRMARARKIRQLKKQMKEWIDQMVEDDDLKTNASQIPAETEISPTDQKVMEAQAGNHNNWGSSADETITNAEPEETPKEQLMAKEQAKEDGLEAEAELVKAKRVGECTFLDFKCRCGSGYSVGIIGQSCFYKLV